MTTGKYMIKLPCNNNRILQINKLLERYINKLKAHKTYEQEKRKAY